MTLSHDDSLLVSWMDSGVESGLNKWGPRVTSQFLQSCNLVTASDRLKPDYYENLELHSELDQLFSGMASCECLEKLVLSILHLSSFHALSNARVLPAVLRLID